jgi:signal transduction histidine kinase
MVAPKEERSRSVALSRPVESRSSIARDTRTRFARFALWLTGLALGTWLLMRALTDESLASQRVLAVMWALTGCSFLFSGLVAWRQRPEKRLGPLMVVLGAWWLAGMAGQLSTAPLVSTLGGFITDAWVVLFVYFLVSFPSGRLASRTERLLVAPFAFVQFPLYLVWLLFVDFGPGAPRNVLLTWPDAAVADAIDTAHRVILVIATFLLAAVLARRWRRASPPLRRRLTPIVAGGGALLVSNVQLVTAKLADADVHEGIVTGMLVVITAVPIAVLVDMLRARLARSAVGDLVMSLHASPAPEDLRDAISRALGDPSLQVAYWLPEYDTYTDLAGQPVELPADLARWTKVVDGSGTPVAALLHDPWLQDERVLLDAVGAAAGLALERARLHADLHARLDELRSTRARIFEAAQSERRRLERDLHDGAQQRLVTLAMDLGTIERRLGEDAEARRSLEQVRAELALSLEELRDLARGIHPAVVTGRGLEAALEGLVVRAPVPVRLSVAVGARPPEPVEIAAYFMVSECLTNVAKYAHASAATVNIVRTNGGLVVEVADDGVGGATGDGGSGLRGLADRVEALGGHLDVTSPVGSGTRVRAEIPCG